MIMSEDNYKKLKDFFDFLIETANDEVAEYYIETLKMATLVARDNVAKAKKDGKN